MNNGLLVFEDSKVNFFSIRKRTITTRLGCYRLPATLPHAPILVHELLHESVSSIPPLDAMNNHHVCATLLGCLAILAAGTGQTQLPPDVACCAAQSGRDGRDGQDGIPGPPGPYGLPKKHCLQEQNEDSSVYMLITSDEVENKRYTAIELVRTIQ